MARIQTGSKKISRPQNRGASMVEYAVLLGAVTLVGIVGFSMLGRKSAAPVQMTAVILPGAQKSDDRKMKETSFLRKAKFNAGASNGAGNGPAFATAVAGGPGGSGIGGATPGDTTDSNWIMPLCDAPAVAAASFSPEKGSSMARACEDGGCVVPERKPPIIIPINPAILKSSGKAAEGAKNKRGGRKSASSQGLGPAGKGFYTTVITENLVFDPADLPGPFIDPSVPYYDPTE